MILLPLLRDLIGIGRGLTASPLPHHRTDGARLRRCGRLRQGGVYTPTGASSPGAPVARSSGRMPSRHSAAGNDSALFRSSRRTVRAFSGGSTPTRGRVGHECPSPTRSRCRAGSSFVQADPRWCRCRPPPWPSADCCRAVRQDRSTLSPVPGHPPELPRSAVTPSVQRRRIDPVHPVCGWRTWWWRAHSSRASHPSSPVRVPRPAPALHAAFTRHLAVTPWRVPGPSAPRTPGQGTFTPEPDRMHGTHAQA